MGYAPCSCMPKTAKRPPILDPFCPRFVAHQSAAVAEPIRPTKMEAMPDDDA